MTRTVFEVTSVPRDRGNPNRYAIRGTAGHVGFLVHTEKGRLLSFATKSGAIRRCDQLNADEHHRITAK